MNVLALNSGSSSLKFGLYRVGEAGCDILVAGEVENSDTGEGRFHAMQAHGKCIADERLQLSSQSEAIGKIGTLLAHEKMGTPDAIGHRIVHGGPRLREDCLLNDGVLRQLEAATPFAPLHIPPALAVIRYSKEHFPGLPQVVCFDTAFHAGLPDVARVLPLPKALQEKGIERYGFHGLSCESILRQLGRDLPDRLVIAHLGNGASVTAVARGTSIDTSMGLTPSGGVIMGTRSGDLDPGVLIYLMRQQKFDAAMLEDLIDHRSGLLGISDVASDMRSLHAAAPANADARLAIEMFCYSVRKEIAAMIAALDGAEMIVFTGGIGENDAAVRASICAGLAWNGVLLDDARNKEASNPISASRSRCAISVLPSREDEEIARHTLAVLATPVV